MLKLTLNNSFRTILIMNHVLGTDIAEAVAVPVFYCIGNFVLYTIKLSERMRSTFFFIK